MVAMIDVKRVSLEASVMGRGIEARREREGTADDFAGPLASHLSPSSREPEASRHA